MPVPYVSVTAKVAKRAVSVHLQNIDHPGGWKTKVLDATFPIEEGPMGEQPPTRLICKANWPLDVTARFA